ncbi:MAG: CHAT domain-containing protein [Deltaproteobacteria bacterium]|jgi:CHAT domain-containing protein|nr:CHAT domain-containing protein [Deltaproteobacteria bacterium]
MKVTKEGVEDKLCMTLKTPLCIIINAIILVFALSLPSIAQENTSTSTDGGVGSNWLPEWNFASTEPEWEKMRKDAENLVLNRKYAEARDIFVNLAEKSKERFGNNDLRTVFMELRAFFSDQSEKDVYEKNKYRLKGEKKLRELWNLLSQIFDTTSPQKFLDQTTYVFGEYSPERVYILKVFALNKDNVGDKEFVTAMYEEIVRIQTKIHSVHNVDTIRDLYNLSYQYIIIRKYEKAIGIIETILENKDVFTDPYDIIILSSISYMAECYEALGNYQLAYELYVEALNTSLQKYDSDDSFVMDLRRSIAHVVNLLGDFALAKTAYTEIIAAMEEQSISQDLMYLLNLKLSLANIYYDLGDETNAQRLYLQVLNADVVVLSTRNLALLYYRIGDYDKAKELYTKLLENTEIDTADSIVVNSALAAISYVQDGRRNSITLFSKALELSEDYFGPDHPRTINIKRNLALVLSDLDDFNAEKVLMEDTFETALITSDFIEITGQMLQSDSSGNTTTSDDTNEDINQGVNHAASNIQNSQETKKDKDATVLMKEAFDSAAITLGIFHPITGSCAYYLGQLYYKSNNLNEAIYYLKLSVNSAQNIRANINSMEDQLALSFMLLVEDRYHYLAKILIESGREEEAQMVISLLKQEEAGKLIPIEAPGITPKGRVTLLSGTAEGPIIVAQEEASQTISALVNKRQILLKKKKNEGLSEGEEIELAKLHEDINSAIEDYRNFVEELPALLEEASQTESSGVDISSIRNLETLQGTLMTLGEGTVLVHTLITKDTLYLFLTSSNVLLVKPVDITRDDLNKLTQDFIELLKDPYYDPREDGKKLYELLIEPISAELTESNATTIMFSLDGSLRYAPMAALYDGEKWLIEKYSIAYFAEAARDKIRTITLEPPFAAGLGLTESKAGFSPLVAVEDEILGIIQVDGSGGVIPGEVYFNDQFTLNNLSDSLLMGANIVHIASHFNFDAFAPDQSFLLLGDGNKLHLRDIERRSSELPFSGLDLLTLSACDTAAGLSDGDGSEIEGFAALSLNKGVTAVIAALWPVDDTSTGLLMREFYRLRYQENMDKALSLREAQLLIKNMEDRITVSQRGIPLSSQDSEAAPISPPKGKPWNEKGFSHPFYWAPFIIIGNWK